MCVNKSELWNHGESWLTQLFGWMNSDYVS